MRNSEILPNPPAAMKSRDTAILYPLGFTAIAVVLLFVVKADGERARVFTACLLSWFVYVSYVCSGLRTSIAAYIFPGMFVFVVFTTPLASLFFYFFRTVLPGSSAANPGLYDAAFAAFFGSGLMEELMKSLPALFGFCLATLPAKSDNRLMRCLGALRCSTPMEGMMIGIAAGAGFVFLDVLYHVVPTSGIYVANSEYLASGVGDLLQLSQRILSGVISHVFWTGISGFFIGLSARRPRLLLVYLATAWLLPAVLHVFWNIAPYLGYGARWIKIVIAALIFVGCFVQARQPDGLRKPSVV
jgi:RsiW-degrading membrane proteinase PrsW (M82 family)